MALVTVQRTPSPHRTQQLLEEDEDDGAVDKTGQPRKSRRSQKNLRKLVSTVNTIRFVNRLSKLLVQRLSYRFSESYFTIKGAALILPKSDKLPHNSRKRTKAKTSTQVSDIQVHLQCMFRELRPNDTIQVAIKLESATSCLRYLAIVVTEGEDDRTEGVIIGFHCTDQTAAIGMVLPIYSSMEISLDGDGGFRVVTGERPHIFKPVSIQAMWSALMSLKKVVQSAQDSSQASGGPTHTWLSHYLDKMTSDQIMINEWEMMDDLMSKRDDSPGLFSNKDENDSLERQIRLHLRELMVGFDLDEVTSLMLRLQLEKRLEISLKAYRWFIDQEMMLIIRQLDSPSKIFDFVYLGSEWNASNLPELQTNGVGYILNVTREIDNFFPGLFKYMNIRLYDDEVSDLMRYWENTHRFICRARDNDSKILVHCKMGVSRSASTVIAFAMKEYGWSLDKAMEEVRDQRAIIRPNDSFMQQLQTYEGILNASKQRWNPKFKCDSGGRPLEDKTLSAAADEVAGGDDAIGEDISEGSFLNPQSSVYMEYSDGGQAHILDTDLEKNSDLTRSDLFESGSDSCDSDSCGSSSTVSYHLEDDDELTNQILRHGEEGQVIGLQYSKLDTDDVMVTHSPSHLQTSSTSNQAGTGGDEMEVEIAEDLTPSTSDQLDTQTQSEPMHIEQSAMHKPITTEAIREIEVRVESCRHNVRPYSSGAADDVAVCHGVINKTREQIAESLHRKQSTTSRVGEHELPVTPGTVRKVLGQIRWKSQEENQLSRSASFKLDRNISHGEEDLLHRSASVKGRSKPSTMAATNERTVSDKRSTEYPNAFAKIQQKRPELEEEKVKFSIGGEQVAGNSSSEDLVKCEKSTSCAGTDANSPPLESNCECARVPEASSKPSRSCARSDCMLKISSKPNLLSDGGNEGADGGSPSPVPVSALVGAFEDIGTAGQMLGRPLTIHVDSFSSDPFAHDQSSEEPSSPIQRSQSMRTIVPDSQPNSASSSITFDIRNVAASKQHGLQPYWKIKRDNSKKLTHSYSSAAMGSSKDVV